MFFPCQLSFGLVEFHSTDWSSATNSREPEGNFRSSLSTWLPSFRNSCNSSCNSRDDWVLFRFCLPVPPRRNCHPIRLKHLPFLHSYPRFSCSLWVTGNSHSSVKNVPKALFPMRSHGVLWPMGPCRPQTWHRLLPPRAEDEKGQQCCRPDSRVPSTKPSSWHTGGPIYFLKKPSPVSPL